MLLKSLFKDVIVGLRPGTLIQNSYIHLSATSNAWHSKLKPCEHFKSYNDKVYPPQSPDEPRRPAFVCHVKENIKYSWKRLWYVSCLIRGMTIDEAFKQLDFVRLKGAVAIKDTLKEAQEMAVNEHNVEFKSNLWVSESFVGKGAHIRGLRRHARGRAGVIRYGYVHYFVTLEEGKPPQHYYPHYRTKSSEEQLAEWLQDMRNRKIPSSL